LEAVWGNCKFFLGGGRIPEKMPGINAGHLCPVSLLHEGAGGLSEDHVQYLTTGRLSGLVGWFTVARSPLAVVRLLIVSAGSD